MNTSTPRQSGKRVAYIAIAALAIGVLLLITFGRQDVQSNLSTNSGVDVDRQRPVSAREGATLQGSSPNADVKRSKSVNDDVEGADTLTVYVTDARDGSPLSNQHVYVGIVAGHASHLISSGLTDQHGCIRIERLGATDDKISVTVPGYLDPESPKAPKRVGHAGYETRFEMKQDLTIEGRIELPSGLLASEVDVEFPSSGRLNVECSVRESGEFAIVGLKPGAYEITARGTSEDAAWIGRTSADAGASNVVVTMRHARRGEEVLLRVDVMDPNGKSIAASGCVWSFSNRHSEVKRMGGTFSETRVQIRLVSGSIYFVHLEEDLELGFGEQLVGPFESTCISIRRVPKRTLTGVVVSEGGEPVADVAVRARAVSKRDHFRGFGWSPADISLGPFHKAITDKQGRFEMDGLGDQPYSIYCNVPPPYCEPDALRSVAGSKDVEIKLTTGVERTIQVVDESGSAVSYAIVIATFVRGATTVQCRATTNQKGSATLHGLREDREYRLDVKPPRHRDDVVSGYLDTWRNGQEQVTLPKAFSISGRVIDESGDPVEDIRVTGQGIDMPYHGTMPFRESESKMSDGYSYSLPRAVSIKDGTFVLQGLRAGRYSVSAEGVSKSVDVSAGESDVTLLLDRGTLPVELKVQFSPWNEADQGTEAILQEQGSFSVIRRTAIGSDGMAVFQSVSRTQRFNVCVLRLTDERCGYRLDIEPRGEVVQVKTQSTGTIRGRFVVPKGFKLADVDNPSIFRFGPSGPVIGDGEEDAAFDVKWNMNDKSFEIRGVPTGPWLVMPYCEIQGKSYSGRVEAQPGDRVEIQLNEDRGE